ncbi:putative alginate O-acetylase AlgI [Flagellimonas maritima]|uniref:Putative alginate O-acetylase AlgI n=1 Tax=Flagellimonas maritima TaxID=1383885 RepID=A0A2Z4LVN0_9FLAO|nr:MBOAT family O-acyltransferase [Allomuricauda aurantiaca]AWX45789.1 putative alginate O-acetylase AlgI [Allomuricauda aurantiaca]
MLFNSFNFLLFFPIVVLGFYLVPHKLRWLWLLAASYYFYMAHEPVLILLLIVSTLVDYYCGLKMYKAKPKTKKLFLALSTGVNIGILFVFKYLYFFTSSIQDFLSFFGASTVQEEPLNSYNFGQLLLPIGISFYTFQTLSYSIEVYRGNFRPEKHLGKFALYVSFFPQLVAGPIERASHLLPQLVRKVSIDLPNIKKGLILMAWGFFLKVVVADRLGIYVDEAFIDPESPHGVSLILGSIFFCFQIYYDFSAYTSIAIGAARVMGYDLVQNFNRPFFATSASQFWKRWHISFMRWLRDYLYRPLVRNFKLNRFSAVIIVFFINGLWHGANWTFVIWSLLNALLLVLEVATNRFRTKLFRKLKIPKRIIALTGWSVMAAYLTISLIFFRSPSIAHALAYIRSMFYFKSLHFNILGNYLELFLCFLFILIVQTIHYFKGNNRVYELVTNQSRPMRWGLYIGYIMVIVLFSINRQNTFIYFQF